MQITFGGNFDHRNVDLDDMEPFQRDFFAIFEFGMIKMQFLHFRVAKN